MFIAGKQIEKRWFWLGCVLLAVLLIAFLMPVLRPKPQQTPQKPVEPPQAQTQWYVKFSVKNQRSTAYVESIGAPKSSSGQPYYVGAVAVHPMQPGSDPRKPLVPFGTIIYTDQPIQVQGREISAFKVIDTGDILYGRYGSYPYWFDIYMGSANSYNSKQASNYGIKPISYYWYEPWR